MLQILFCVIALGLYWIVSSNVVNKRSGKCYIFKFKVKHTNAEKSMLCHKLDCANLPTSSLNSSVGKFWRQAKLKMRYGAAVNHRLTILWKRCEMISMDTSWLRLAWRRMSRSTSSLKRNERNFWHSVPLSLNIVFFQ